MHVYRLYATLWLTAGKNAYVQSIDRGTPVNAWIATCGQTTDRIRCWGAGRTLT
jgi:hypothetical protein